MKPKVVQKEITIPEPQINKVAVTIKGTSPLIMHEWSEKSKREIRDKQQMKAKTKRGARDPKAEYESAKIKNSKGKLAIKAIWIKNAVVSSARFVENLPMTILRGALFVNSDEDGLIELRYKKEEMVEDTVRLSGIGRTADLRYRPYIYDWEADVEIEYDADVLTMEQVIHLLKKAGFSNGLGENRPERSGDNYGRFTVEPVKA
jgi:hypothetical protein